MISYCWRVLVRTGSRRLDRNWIIVASPSPMAAMGRAEYIVAQMKRVTFAQAVAIVQLHPVKVHSRWG